MAAWHQQYVVEPMEELLAMVPVGGEVRDLDRCQKLGIGVEGLFRTEVAQYAGWPPPTRVDDRRIVGGSLHPIGR